MRPLFLAGLAYAALSRVLELTLSRRHERRLRGRGARLVRDDAMGAIVAVHAAWFGLLVVEELTLGPTLRAAAPRLLAAGVLGLAELSRAACMVSLGERWSIRVVVLDRAPPVRTGLYRFARHPIYVAVTVMLAALPLALGLVVTPLLVVPVQLLVLRRRIRIEERELAAAAAGGPGGPPDGAAPGP